MFRHFVRSVAALAFVVASSQAASAAIIAINFDQDVAGTAGGNLFYNGAGGAAIGTSIDFDNVSIDLNDDSSVDATYQCVNCTLSFTTGGNTDEDPLYLFANGGTFELEGQIFDGATLVADSTGDASFLLSGSFAGPTNGAVGFFSANNSFTLIGVGDDTKHPDLLSYIVTDLGIAAINPDFQYVNTTFTTSACIPGATGGFNCAVNNSDLGNIGDFTPFDTPVPEPGSMILLGTGLMGLATSARRRLRRK